MARKNYTPEYRTDAVRNALVTTEPQVLGESPGAEFVSPSRSRPPLYALNLTRSVCQWVMQYVDGDPANSSEQTKAKKPLAAAEVVVEEDPANPGYYSSKFFLRPHYQLEGLTVSLRLVSKLPSVKG